jgi:hypothetical protein
VRTLKPLYEAEAKERLVTSGPGVYGGKPPSVDRRYPVERRSNRYGKAVQAAAKDLGLSASLLERTSRVAKLRPDLMEKVERGERSVEGAKDTSKTSTVAISLPQGYCRGL